ncbi:MAG: STAS domain-containing protein [Actinomycetota bacterium]|nr:STAS domain-containing protein [Actinomycetota bacterium]
MTYTRSDDGSTDRPLPRFEDTGWYTGGTGLLGVRTRFETTQARVELAGELCLFSASAFDVHLQVLIAFGRPDLEIDASGLDLLSAAGVRVLLENARRCAGDGGRLRLVAASPPAHRVLDVCGLSEHLGLGSRRPFGDRWSSAPRGRRRCRRVPTAAR